MQELVDREWHRGTEHRLFQRSAPALFNVVDVFCQWVQWIEVAVDDDDDDDDDGDDDGWCGSGKKSQKLNLESDSNYIKHQTWNIQTEINMFEVRHYPIHSFPFLAQQVGQFVNLRKCLGSAIGELVRVGVVHPHVGLIILAAWRGRKGGKVHIGDMCGCPESKHTLPLPGPLTNLTTFASGLESMKAARFRVGRLMLQSIRLMATTWPTSYLRNRKHLCASYQWQWHFNLTLDLIWKQESELWHVTLLGEAENGSEALSEAQDEALHRRTPEMVSAPEMWNMTRERSKEVQVFGYFKHRERSSPSGSYFPSHCKGLARHG